MASLRLNPALGGQIESNTIQPLDGLDFRVRLFWLAEAPVIPFQTTPPPPLELAEPGVWTLDLAQADGTIIAQGQVLRHGVNILRGWRGDPRFPGAGYGRLLAWDTTGAMRDPGRNDLDPGSELRLVYSPAGDA